MRRPLHFVPGMLVRPKRNMHVTVWDGYKVESRPYDGTDSSRKVDLSRDLRVSMDGKQLSKVRLNSLAIIVCVPYPNLIGFFCPAQNLFAYTWESYLVAVL